MCVVKVTWPISTFWGPGRIFGVDEARHFKFGMRSDRKEYYHMHVKLPQYEVYSGSYDLLRFFLEIIADISETTQDKNKITMED